MILSNYRGTSSLTIKSIQRIENLIKFCVDIILCDKDTDTDITFNAESNIRIEEWPQRSEILLSQGKLELENFSFHTNYKTFHLDNKECVRIQNVFKVSSNINNSSIEFIIESNDCWEKMFYEEIDSFLRKQPVLCNTTSFQCADEGLIHIRLKTINVYSDGRFNLQLNVYSDSFHIIRYFNDDCESQKYESMIRQFNEGKINQFTVSGEFLRIDFNWIDGKKRGRGSIDDFSWPGPNEIVFDDFIDIELEHVDREELPLIPVATIPTSSNDIKEQLGPLIPGLFD